MTLFQFLEFANLSPKAISSKQIYNNKALYNFWDILPIFCYGLIDFENVRIKKI